MSGRAQATGRGAALREEWIERVRGATDIVELVGQTVTLRKVGRNWMGLCPFHQEKTASFSVHAERQFYHCFSCKAGGDVFKFVQETEKIGFLEAAELLSRRAGIPVPERRGEAPGTTGLRARLLEALDSAARSYEQWLADPERGREARAYLSGRGLTPESVRAFRVGLAPAGWENLCQRLGAKAGLDTLVEAGLAVRRAEEPGGAGARGGAYDRFRNRIMVPLVAPGGAVVGFGARALAAEDQPKYLNSPETAVYHKGSFLFALEQARKSVESDGELVVVEGYFDAIALHQHGIRNTIATSGTALTADQARMIRRVAPRVALTYDGDAAGQDATMRSLGVLLAEGLDVVVVELPPATDPDLLLRSRGLPGWEEARRSAYDAVGFIQRHLLRAGGADPRERALRAVVELGVLVGDEIRRRLLFERASRVFGLSEAVLDRAASLKRRGQRSEEPVRAAVRSQRAGKASLERQALQALLMAPGALEYARAEIGPEDFEEPQCAALATRLWAGAAPGGTEEEPTAALERELQASARPDEQWDGLARAATLKLSLRKLARELRQVQERLARAGGGPEADGLKQRASEIVSRQLVRDELYRRLWQQTRDPKEESDPERILQDLKEIEMRATGRTND